MKLYRMQVGGSKRALVPIVIALVAATILAKMIIGELTSTAPPMETAPVVARPAIPGRPVEHPRLFFSESDLPAIREKAIGSHREISAPVLSFAQRQLNSAAPKVPDEGDLDGFRNAGNALIVEAFAYVLTGDQRYLALAQRDMLAHASWQYWGDEGSYGNRDLGFHHMLLGNALAYDWLHNNLLEEDRATIRRNLVRRTQESFEASSTSEYRWNNWWRKAYTQNHYWTNNSALGMAALALEGEDERWRQWLDHAASQMSKVSNLLEGIGDGSWHEGIPYQSYGLTMSLPFYQNLRTLHGQDLIPHSYLRNYTQWRIYNGLAGSNRFVLPYGNMDWSWGNPYGPQGILRFNAREYRDGGAEWMAQQMVSADRRPPNVFTTPWNVFEFLYYDPMVTPQPPAPLPPDRLFGDLQGVIWRTGWGEKDLVFGLKASAPGGRFGFDRFVSQASPFDPASNIDVMNTGHDHADSGTFYLYRGATELTGERTGDGASDTRLHNSILVDGQGQYRPPDSEDPSYFAGTDARLESAGWTTNYSFLVADTTRQYRATRVDGRPGQGLLEESRRYVLFVKPDYLLLVDRVRSATPRSYDWIVHFPSKPTVEGDWIKAAATPDNILGIRIVQPSGFSAMVEADEKPLVRVSPGSKSPSTTFATVLFPTNATGWESRPSITSLGGDDQATGIRVAMNGIQDHLIRHGTSQPFRLDEYLADARFASVVKATGGRVQRLFIADGKRLADVDGSRTLIESAQPVKSLEVSYQGARMVVVSSDLRQASIYAPGMDETQVTVNGRSVIAGRNGDYLTVSSP